MKTKDCFTELAIQISTLNMKLDAILKLLNKHEVELKPFQVKKIEDVLRECPLQFEDVVPSDSNLSFVDGKPGHGASFVGVIDYLGGSEDEQFLENYK